MAKITINDSEIELESNENENDRGLHIVVINPASGKIENK